VTVIDVTGDGKGEVIVGYPGKDGGKGSVAVVRGTDAGVSTTTGQILLPDRIGATERLGRFGQTLLR
jgi:FG-GAP repeat